MLRTALKPRWLALFGLLVAVVVAFTMLGLWQLNVAKAKGSAEAIAKVEHATPQPLTDVIRPHQTFPKYGSLKPVTVKGHYEAGHQVLIAGRVLHGKSGFWVLTPMVVERTGARVAVIRGFVSSPDQARPPATGSRELTVSGALAPGESPSTGSYPKGQLGTVDLGLLLNRWGGSIYNAFVFMTAESPHATTSPIKTFPPPQPAKQGLKLLNAGYALQWWFFALFAIYLYWRMLRDEHHESAEGEPGRDTDQGAGDNGGANRSQPKDAHA